MNEEGKNQPLSGRRRDFSNLRALGSTALAGLLYLLLLDAAVETFFRDSPVRWWVAIPVAVYLVGSAALWWRGHPLWQRYTWATKATTSLFVLLCLLALTAWLPGGLSNGLRVLGLSTSTLLSLVTAVAIAFSGLLLFQLRYPQPAIKWAIAGLTAYGMIAFVWGIFAGTPYPSLFQGQSFWTWLPRWLQGAFIGALVIVPLAVVVEIFNALKVAREADGKKWKLEQTLALAMSAVMALSGVMARPGLRGPQPSAAQITEPLQKSYHELGVAMAGSKQGAQASPKEIADRLEKLFQALEAAEREIPRDTFDPKAIVEKVGRDPLKLFDWVRDNTYLVPYRGLLRGDTGVLMDRLGNSLDRAMLLYQLLRLAGQQVRLAHGTLTEKQAKDMLQKARPIPKDGVPALRRSLEIPDDLLQKVAAQNQTDHAQLRKLVANITTEQERMKESVMRRVSEQASFIAAAVGKPEEDIRKKEEAAAVEAIRDHWWVQLQQGSTWVNLDPTLPNATPGDTLSQPAKTIQPEYLTQLGEENLHMVQIQVVVEFWERDGLKEVPVLTQKLLPAGLLGERIALRHIPMHWPKDLDLFKEKDPVRALKAAALAQTEWMPILSLGSRNISRYTFTDDGFINDTTLPGYIAAVMAGRKFLRGAEAGTEKAAEGVKDILGGGGIGGLGGRREEKPVKEKTEKAGEPRSSTRLTAEWIDYEIRVPGQAPRKIRREIFDLVGPATRSTKKVTAPEIAEAQRLERGLILLGETDILPLVSQLSPQFVEHLIARNMLGNREVLLNLFRNIGSADFKSLNEQASKIKSMPFQLYSLALARRDWSRFRGDIYLDRPNILSYHKRLRPSLKGEVLQEEGFDIVANEVVVLPGSKSDPFLVGIEQGALDTNAESLLAQRRGARVENTAEMFAETGSTGIEWVGIRDARQLAWQGVELPKDVRARVEQDLAAGYAVLVPKKGAPREGHVAVGWWRVHPGSGQTLGIGERGWGQTAAEWVHFTGVALIMINTSLCGYIMAANIEKLRGDETDLTDYRKRVVREGAKGILCQAAGIVAFGAVMVGGLPVGVWGLAAAIVTLLSQLERGLP